MEKEKLLEGDLKASFRSFLVPAIGGMLGTAAYVLGDTIMVGQALGAQGLAALNITLPIFRLTNGTAFMIGVGGATTVSILRGQNQEERANDVFNMSMILSTFLGIFLILVRFLWLDQIVWGLGATDYTYHMVREYFSILLPMMIFAGVNVVLSFFVRNDGSPKLVMLATLVSSIFNLVLDYIFIFIWDWGIWGASFATVLSPIVSLMILSLHFIKKRNSLYFKKPSFNSYYLKRIFRNGFPNFIVEISVGISIYLFNITLTRMQGDLGVSVYGIIMNLSLFVIAIFNGVGQAIQPIVSINHGADKDDRAREAGAMGVRTGFILGVSFFLIGIIFPDFLAKIFTSERGEIIDMSVTAIRLYFLAYIFMGVNIATISYSQSIEEIRQSIVISILKGSVFVILYLKILSSLMGIKGVWLSVALAELSTFIFYMIFSEDIRRMIFPVKNKYTIRKLQD